MHNIRGLTLIAILTIVIQTQGSPLNDKENAPQSLRNRLELYTKSKCPYLGNTTLLAFEFLNQCSDYNTIKSITYFTGATSSDVLCLLYYNNFVSLCDALTNTTTLGENALNSTVKDYNLDRTCNDLPASPLIVDLKVMQHVVDGLKSNSMCDFVCGEGKEGVAQICSYAAVTMNLTREFKQRQAKIAKEKVDASNQMKQPPPVAEHNLENSATKQKLPAKPAISVSDPNPKKIEESILAKAQSPSEPMLESSSEAKVQDNNMNVVDLVKTNAEQSKLTEKPITKVIDENPHTMVKTVSEMKSEKKETIVGEEKPEKEETSMSNMKSEKKETVIGETKAEEENKVIEEKSPQEHLSNTEIETDNHEEGEGQNNAELASQDQPKKEENGNSVEIVEESPKQETKIDPKLQQALTIEDDSIDVDNRDEMDPQFAENAQNAESNEDPDDIPVDQPRKIAELIRTHVKPQETDEDALMPAYSNSSTDEEDSFFFMYFMMVCAVFILGYIGYHNKQKVLALVIEGRRGRRNSRRGRPNSANYHKLDSNLEEAVTSSCNKNTTSIIY